MNQTEFSKKFESEKHLYNSWGYYAQSRILNELEKQVDLQTFIKINSEPRIKETNSLIQKAFYRGKNYKDPYNDITDKVGIRFVVLLNDDIRTVCTTLESIPDWTYSEDRNYENERLKNPELFTYQSVHYVIRSKAGLVYEGTDIPPGLPCEVQIRTLLQHAYSELTHDTVYKNKTKSRPEVHRKIARSMALIEAADELFGEVNNMLNAKDVLFESLMSNLRLAYSKITEPDYVKELNMFIFDSYQEVIDSIDIADINRYLLNKPIIAELVRKNFDSSLLHRQPIILFLYYFITRKRNKALKLWPLTEKEIEPLYTDLGINIPD